MSGEDKASDWSSWDRRWGDSSLREQCDRPEGEEGQAGTAREGYVGQIPSL